MKVEAIFNFTVKNSLNFWLNFGYDLSSVGPWSDLRTPYKAG